MEGPPAVWQLNLTTLCRRLAEAVEENVAEQAVVGGYEAALGRFQQDGAPIRADAWVHHCHVNGVLGEITVAVMEQKRSLEYVLGGNPVGYIYNLSVGVDAEDDALHQSDVGILKAEVRRQCDDGLGGGQGPILRSASPGGWRR